MSWPTKGFEKTFALISDKREKMEPKGMCVYVCIDVCVLKQRTQPVALVVSCLIPTCARQLPS